MPVRGNAQEIANRWKTRTTAAVPEAVAGARRVQESPGVAAARQVQAYQQNVQASVPKWQKNVAKMSTQEWLAAYEQGSNRIASGVASKVGKMERHMTNFIPHLETVQRELAGMPRGDLESNLARMLHNARRNAQYQSPA